MAKRRVQHGAGIADRRSVERVIDQAYVRLNQLSDWGYPYPKDDAGHSYRGSMRGPDYLRFMRRQLRNAGVLILDQSPAFELLLADGVAAGARGISRLTGRTWAVRAASVVLATGGCAFLSGALGTNGLTGEGLLMAAEAGATFSSMEFTGQYGISPAFASVTKGIIYFWATFTDIDGNEIGGSGDRQIDVASQLLKNEPVFAVIDRASPRLQEGMRKGQPNIFLPFDRRGIDPFNQRFPVTLRYEGTVRGVGGISIDEVCATNVAGLFAAGDAATREGMAGAVSGGGGPNATWAMASGTWAGRSAARFVQEVGSRYTQRKHRAVGTVGTGQANFKIDDNASHAFIKAVQDEILPLHRNFYRSGSGLQGSLNRLNVLWDEAARVLGGAAGVPAERVRAREAAGMLANARWIVASALLRRESRGISRRSDFKFQDVSQQHRIAAGGLDRVWVHPDVAEKALAS
jgi:succinate dehydrogenase/fumarate reductase flavoprotein subunit